MMKRVCTLLLTMAVLLLPPLLPHAYGIRLYPQLEPVSQFSGEVTTPAGQCSTELFLLEKNFCVLRLMTPSNRGQAIVHDVVGTWRQVMGGAILRLMNRHGLSLDLNVGAAGNVYGDLPFGGELGHRTLVLRSVPFRLHEFCTMGKFLREGKRATVTDSATGRIIPADNCEKSEDVPEGIPVFADVVVMPESQGLRVVRVRSFSRTFPLGFVDETRGDVTDFGNDVVGTSWILTAPDMPHSTWRFVGHPKGILEITGVGLRIEARYTVNEHAVSIELDAKDILSLRACGAESMKTLLQDVSAWSLEGDILWLSTVDGRSLQLESRMIRR